MQRFAELDGAWKEPFDAQRPLDTPQGIALDRPQVATQVRQALADAAAEVEKSGIPDGARWGDLQVSTRGQERIAIPGGDGHFGVYNAIQSVRKGDHLEVVGGTSYIQLVTFPRKGPRLAGCWLSPSPAIRARRTTATRPSCFPASNGRPCRSATGRSTPTRNCNG